MKYGFRGIIRKGKRRKRARIKKTSDSSDDCGEHRFILTDRTAKFIRKNYACEFGCFYFKRIVKYIRAPPLPFVQI